MAAKCMKSYLKQAHTKEVEKTGVNSYKVLFVISTIQNNEQS
jgi:hypothetical protein